MKTLKRKTLAALLALSLLASLLPLGAQPALAADGDQTVYVGGENVTSGGYWTTDDSGNVTVYSGEGAPTDNYIYYNAANNTLTLHNATIKESVSSNTSTLINGAAIGVANQSGVAELTIKLEGSNAIENVSTGICVLAFSYSTGDASLTITGSGSLDTSGRNNPAIRVQSNGGNATLSIEKAKVTATASSSGYGVLVQSKNDSSVSLTVDGGNLIATGSGNDGAGIQLLFGSGDSGSGTPTVTVSNNAIMRASGNAGGITSNASAATPSGKGIVFDGGTGTVYGSVTLQEDLTIGEDESLTIPEGSSLTIPDDKTLTNKGEVKTEGSGSLTNSGTINNSGTLPNGIGGTVNHAPKITTTTLPNGIVGTAYNQTLAADGTTPITWSVTSGSLPTGLSLNASTGAITGTPSSEGTSTFIVKAENAYGSDSKELSIAIDSATTTPVTGVTLNKSTTELIVDQSETLTATVKPDNATNKNVTWSSSAGSVATVDANGKVTAVSPGSATITVKTEDGSHTATCTVTVTAKTYSLSVDKSTLNFGSITEGDALPAAQTVTVKNTGNQRVTIVQPTANNFEIGALSLTELEPNASATFTIQPKDNLPRGSYSEQIVIAGDNNASATLTATFTVKEPPYTGKYSYELSTSVGDHGSLTVDRYATEGEKVTITVTPDEAYKLDDLVVTAGGKEVTLTAGGDGTYTFTMPSADVKISATFAEDPDWTEPEEPATDVSDIFLDIAPNAWYKDAVQYAYAGGLMTGVSANKFAPEATTTRAMIVSMLARLEGVESAESAGFADVAANDWYATAVNWAAASGITSGTGDGNFSPNTAITREQLAAILMNYAQYKGQDVSARATLDTYNDAAAISSWANDVMSWAVAEGLLTGVTNDQLQPQGNATRAQVAAILERFLAE